MIRARERLDQLHELAVAAEEETRRVGLIDEVSPLLDALVTDAELTLEERNDIVREWNRSYLRARLQRAFRTKDRKAIRKCSTAIADYGLL